VLIPEAEAANARFFHGFSAADRATFLDLMCRALGNMESVENITEGNITEGMYA